MRLFDPSHDAGEHSDDESEDADDEEHVLGLKGPTNTVKYLKQFLLNFMRRHGLQNLKIRIDGMDETLTNFRKKQRRM